MSIATCRGHVKVLDVLDGSPRRSELLKEIAALLKSHREDDARRNFWQFHHAFEAGGPFSGNVGGRKEWKPNPAKRMCYF